MGPFEFNTRYVQEPEAYAVCGRYADGSVAIQVHSDIGEPLTTATVCLAQYGKKPEEGNVFVYGNYSEHWGVLEALQKAGIVGEPVQRIDFGGYDGHCFEVPLLKEC